jgi:hypothetical protein
VGLFHGHLFGAESDAAADAVDMCVHGESRHP